MAKYCLPQDLALKFAKAVEDGTINPFILADAPSSAARRAELSKVVGDEHAKELNTLFERKMTLKFKEKGYISWAEKATGIKPEVKRDLISRIQKMTQEEDINILDPDTEKAFLEDLASSRLGINVTRAEAQEISRLSSKIADTKIKAEEAIEIEFNKETPPTKEQAAEAKAVRIEYGKSIIDMNEFLASLKPGKSQYEKLGEIVNVPRALMSTMDLSAPFRQGWGMVTRKEFWKNLKPMVEAAFNKEKFKELQADIISRPNYGMAKKAGLRITGLGDKLSEREEEFLTTLLDNIPGISGSQRAYTGFLAKLRADSFDAYVNAAKLSGENVEVGSKVAKELANVVNNFTGAGTIGKADYLSPVFSQLFFSPRKNIATFQMFNPVKYLNRKISPTARKEAFKNLIGSMSATATTLGLAQMAGAEIEWNPASTDFGKIKIGTTRFDMSGGNASWLRLWTNIIGGWKKSTTGNWTNLREKKFGQANTGTVAARYIWGKMSPIASFITDAFFQENVIGTDFSLTELQPSKNALLSRVIPMNISEIIDTAMEDQSMILPVLLTNMFGIGASTYEKDAKGAKKPSSRTDGATSSASGVPKPPSRASGEASTPGGVTRPPSRS